MNISYINEYVSLAESLNFSEAAKQHFISQSTLSKHILAIEKEIGAVLFVRNTHKTCLTPEGEIAYKRFKEIVSLYDAVLCEVRQNLDGISGHLKIAFFYHGGIEYLQDSLITFRKNYSGIELSFLAYQQHQIIDALQHDKTDIGLVMQSKALPQRDYEYIPVDNCKLRVYTSKKCPLAEKHSISLSDLEGHTLLLVTNDREYSEVLLQMFEKSGIALGNVVYCEQFDLVPVALDMENAFFVGAEKVKTAMGSRVIGVDITEEIFRLPLFLVYKKTNHNPCILPYVNSWKR